MPVSSSFVRPSHLDRNAQAAELGRQRHGINQDQSPQARARRKIQFADQSYNLRIVAMRAEVLEQIDRGIIGILHAAQRRHSLASFNKGLGRLRRYRRKALGYRPLGNRQSQFAGDIAHHANQRDSSGVSIEMMGLCARMRSLRFAEVMARLVRPVKLADAVFARASRVELRLIVSELGCPVKPPVGEPCVRSCY